MRRASLAFGLDRGRRVERASQRPPGRCTDDECKGWRACGRPVARYSRSTRWPSPATGTGTRWRARSPTPVTRSCWPTSCARTWPLTVGCLTTPTRPGHRGPRPCQQDAVWDRTCAHNKLRSLLREYHPGLLAAFAGKRRGLLRPDARVLLAAAPTPRAAAKLTRTQLRALLVRAGRKRGIDSEIDRIQPILRREYLHQLPLVEDAFRASGAGPAPPAQRRRHQRRRAGHRRDRTLR